MRKIAILSFVVSLMLFPVKVRASSCVGLTGDSGSSKLFECIQELKTRIDEINPPEAGPEGPPGPAGPQGPKGEPGTPGADASLPARSVVPFELMSCPVGWEEYKEAYGRFIRGIDRTRTPIQ